MLCRASPDSTGELSGPTEEEEEEEEEEGEGEGEALTSMPLPRPDSEATAVRKEKERCRAGGASREEGEDTTASFLQKRRRRRGIHLVPLCDLPREPFPSNNKGRGERAPGRETPATTLPQCYFLSKSLITAE